MKKVITRFWFSGKELPETILPTFADELEELFGYDHAEEQMQNCLDFINLLMALDEKKYAKMCGYVEKTKWALDQNTIIIQNCSSFHDVLRTFETLSSMANDLGDDFNPDFLNMGLSYKIRTLSLEAILTGQNLKKVIWTTEHEDLVFKDDLKLLPLVIDADTATELLLVDLPFLSQNVESSNTLKFLPEVSLVFAELVEDLLAHFAELCQSHGLR